MEDSTALGEGPRSAPSRSALPLVLGIAGLAFLLAGLSLSGFAVGADHPAWQSALVTALSLPLVLGGGAAFGPLLRATPVVEPSPLKLGLFSSALSPVLVALLWYGFAIQLELPVGTAWAATFGAIGVLALLGAGRRLSAARAGRAAGLVCAFALLAAALAALAASSRAGLEVRLGSHSTIAQAAFAQALQDGPGWQNPWVAGLPLELRPGIAALLVAAAGPAKLLPLYCLSFVIAWCAALLTVAAYLASAALFRETSEARAGLRDASAALAVLLVAAALDGGRASIHRWLSMAYTMTFLVAALHAVRRGARPWPGLSACLLAVLGVLHPWLGLGSMAALGVAGLLAGRTLLPALAGLAMLPGFWLARLYGGWSLEQSVPHAAPRSIREPLGARAGRFLEEHLGLGEAGADPSPLAWAAAYAPVLLGAAGLLALALRGGRERTASTDVRADRRAARLGAVLVLLLIAGSTGLVMALPADAAGEAPALFAAALLIASVCVGRAIQCVPGRASLLVGAVFLAGVALPLYRTLDAARDRGAPASLPFEEHAGHLALATEPPLQEGLEEALEFLRSSPYARDQRAILFREPGPTGPVRRDEPLSLAPVLTGLSLFGTSAHSPGTDQSRALAPPRAPLRTSLGDTPRERRELLNALFKLEAKWHPRFARTFDALREKGHTLVFIVTERDRRNTTDRGTGPRGVDDVLRRVGAEVVFEAEEAAVYVAPPALSR